MKQKLLATLVLSGMTAISFAQPTPTSPPVVGGQPVAVQAPTLGQANTFERETTPLLREISRKKATLELRRLGREIEKLEEESLKARAERRLIESGAVNPMMGGQFGGVPMGMYQPTPLSQRPNMPGQQQAQQEQERPEHEIGVFMIYGFEGSLMAKITMGQQGGFVVRKGDRLPNGNIVLDITANYIEIGDAVNAGDANRESEKIFVRALSVGNTQNNSGQQQANTQTQTPGMLPLIASPNPPPIGRGR